MTSAQNDAGVLMYEVEYTHHASHFDKSIQSTCTTAKRAIMRSCDSCLTV